MPRLLRSSGIGLLPALLCLLLGAQSARAAASLESIRVGVSPTQTRVVLDLKGDEYEFRQSESEDGSLLITFPGAALGPQVMPPGSQGLLLGVAVLEEESGVLVRIRYQAGCETRLFRLPADGGRPKRLVIDLFAPDGLPVPEPEGAQDPDPLPRRKGPRVVVIDPGHGGKDPGAVGNGLNEKDVVLDVAKRLCDRLNEESGIRAVLTREKDVLVPLRRRMRIAEEENADLFVSIHVNASRSRRAHGAEVFFLSIGAASDEASRELARLENEADPDYVVDEDADLQGVPFMVDLRQSDTLLRSSRAAEEVLDALTDKGLTASRGVKQAGFVVLKSFQVPSVLVELGFISSEQDRKQLATPAHRARLAQGMADGIRRYFERYAPRRAEEQP